MYNVAWLYQVARAGLLDLLPAIRQAFNADPDDDRLEAVYGGRPRRAILLIAVAGATAGALFARAGPDFPLKGDVNWAAIVLAGVHALLIRRYLFKTGSAGDGDFPWLAASVAPAVALLMFLSAVTALTPDAPESDIAPLAFLGDVLVAVTDALGVAAALTIAVATLCYSRNWLQALWDLALRLFVFKLTVWVTVLVMLEIGIVGPIVSAVLRSAFGISIPAWLPDLFDQISYAGLLSIAYLAVIGATWTVCRRSFPELLATGQVDVLATVAKMAKDPEKARKKEAKKEAKQAAKARKKAGEDASPPAPTEGPGEE